MPINLTRLLLLIFYASHIRIKFTRIRDAFIRQPVDLKATRARLDECHTKSRFNQELFRDDSDAKIWRSKLGFSRLHAVEISN